ncbi:MAG: signal peptide peptidase SppA [Phycisphaerae bacterium]|nr:signal peptide peptidase SppA [Phycisphaerae bacterium]
MRFRQEPVVGVTVHLLSAALVLAIVGCGPAGGYKITPIPADQTLEETVMMREPGLLVVDRIAVIDVDGMITNTRKNGLLTEGENPVSLLTEKLNRAEKDGRVKAVVLRINSPGGGVTASHLMYEEIKAFRERTGRPVVAMMLDLATSGGYYIACACDEIIAHPTSVTGSIGVIMLTFQVNKALEKLYITSNIFKSGPRKDSGSPFRDMTDEDREIFQGLIDNYYEKFLGVVQGNRTKLTPERIRELADGRVYSADEALSYGLVDRIGSMQQAIAAAKKRSGAGKVKVVRYHRPLDWAPNVYARSPVDQPSAINLINVNLPDWLRPSAPQFMYLWVPGR